MTSGSCLSFDVWPLTLIRCSRESRQGRLETLSHIHMSYLVHTVLRTAGR